VTVLHVRRSIRLDRLNVSCMKLLILIFEKRKTVVVSLHQYCAGNCSLLEVGLIYSLFGKLLSPGFMVM